MPADTVDDEGPDGYVGRRQADEQGRRLVWADVEDGTVCPSPASHYHLERSAAQELRLPSTTDPSLCPWCELPYNPRRA